MPGPTPDPSPEEVYEFLKSTSRLVITGSDVMKQFDVTRPPATDRLNTLETEYDDVYRIDVGGSRAYFVSEKIEDVAEVGGIEIIDLHTNSIRREFENRYVGVGADPRTAVHPNDGHTEGGDRVQLFIYGEPGQWQIFERYTWENRRENLGAPELIPGKTNALITGEVYKRPTVPIEHEDYPDDYLLEERTGAKMEGEPPDEVLIAVGPKNYLLQPYNDAAFLKNVQVDWVEIVSSDNDAEETEPDVEGMIEKVQEWREKNIEGE